MAQMIQKQYMKAIFDTIHSSDHICHKHYSQITKYIYNQHWNNLSRVLWELTLTTNDKMAVTCNWWGVIDEGADWESECMKEAGGENMRICVEIVKLEAQCNIWASIP